MPDGRLAGLIPLLAIEVGSLTFPMVSDEARFYDSRSRTSELDD
jgi:hypothetical protein